MMKKIQHANKVDFEPKTENQVQNPVQKHAFANIQWVTVNSAKTEVKLKVKGETKTVN